jgi:hypothetical protein
MSAILITAIVFACVFGSALLGKFLQRVLPEHHRDSESKDLIKSAMGLIGTISALVLGLLVASAKSSYDTQKEEVTSLAAHVGLLDRMLAHYGPEAEPARAQLRGVVSRAIVEMWRGSGEAPEDRADVLFDSVASLQSKTESQRALQAQASTLMIELGRTRWLLVAQSGSSISTPLLVVVVFWLSISFVSFGLFAHRNATVTAALFIAALSVAGAVFLILEMDRPFEGLIQISDAPLRQTLSHLGR